MGDDPIRKTPAHVGELRALFVCSNGAVDLLADDTAFERACCAKAPASSEHNGALLRSYVLRSKLLNILRSGHCCTPFLFNELQQITLSHQPLRKKFITLVNNYFEEEKKNVEVETPRRNQFVKTIGLDPLAAKDE